jgi:hypothetical protein
MLLQVAINRWCPETEQHKEQLSDDMPRDKAWQHNKACETFSEQIAATQNIE